MNSDVDRFCKSRTDWSHLYHTSPHLKVAFENFSTVHMEKEPCVRKFEGLARSKLLGISQTDDRGDRASILRNVRRHHYVAEGDYTCSISGFDVKAEPNSDI